MVHLPRLVSRTDLPTCPLRIPSFTLLVCSLFRAWILLQFFGDLHRLVFVMWLRCQHSFFSTNFPILCALWPFAILLSVCSAQVPRYTSPCPCVRIVVVSSKAKASLSSPHLLHCAVPSRNTVSVRVHIYSAGVEEEAPCTDASYTCADSLLNRDLTTKASGRACPATPQYFIAEEDPNSSSVKVSSMYWPIWS